MRRSAVLLSVFAVALAGLWFTTGKQPRLAPSASIPLVIDQDPSTTLVASAPHVRTQLLQSTALSVLVLDAESSQPVASADILTAAPSIRLCTVHNSTLLSTTNHQGRAVLPREELPKDTTQELFVFATGYLPQPLSIRSNDSEAVARMRRGHDVAVVCTNEDDGTPLEGASVALSRTAVSSQGLMGYGAPDANQDSRSWPGPCAEHAIATARSDAQGVARVSGLDSGAYRVCAWHEDAVPVAGLPARATVHVPAGTLTVKFRRMFGIVAIASGNGTVRGATVDRNPNVFQKDNGHGIAAGVRLSRRLHAEYPRAAIFVGLPRREFLSKRLQATARFLVDGAGIVEREIDLRAVTHGRIEPDTIKVMNSNVPAGRARITLRAPGGQVVELPLHIATQGLLLQASSGTWVDLPVGPYGFSVASRAAPELWEQRTAATGTFEVRAGIDTDVEEQIDDVYLPCRLDVRFPHDDSGTVLLVDFVRDGSLTARMVNWSPAWDSPQVWLRPGRVLVRAYGVDLATEPVALEVVREDDVRRATLLLTRSLAK